MRHLTIFAATIAFMVSGSALAASSAPASKGVKCGNSYIAAGKVCTKAPPAPTSKGVKCGNSYIAANKVCTKKK